MILERSKGSGDHSDGGHETFRNSGSSLGKFERWLWGHRDPCLGFCEKR